MFLSNIVIRSCIIIHFIKEENIFPLSFEINGKQRIIMHERGEYVKFKIMTEK